MTTNSRRPGWTTVRLGSVVSQISTRIDNPSEAEADRFVGLEHFDSGELKIRRWGTTADLISAMKLFKAGDTLFARRNAYLRRASMVDFDGVCSGDAIVLRPKESVIIGELLPAILNTDTFWDYALSHAAGSMSKRVNIRNLLSYEFALPPIEEQKRIAELLWAADEATQSYETALEKTNQLLDVIRETVVCDGRFEQCKLGGILTSIVAGKSVSGASTPARPDEYGVLKVSAVGPNGFDPIENKRLIDQSEFLPQYRVRRNSLLITRCNTTDLVGRVCLTENDDSNLMLCDKTLELVPDESKLSKLLLFEVLRSRGLRTQIRSRATGTGGAMKNISQDDIRSLVVPIPDGQTVIAGRVLAVTDRIGSINQHLSLMRSVAKQLSNELMSGRGADHV